MVNNILLVQFFFIIVDDGVGGQSSFSPAVQPSNEHPSVDAPPSKEVMELHLSQIVIDEFSSSGSMEGESSAKEKPNASANSSPILKK